MDLALNNQEWLICHKNQPNRTICLGVVANERGAFMSPLIMVANFLYLFHN